MAPTRCEPNELGRKFRATSGKERGKVPSFDTGGSLSHRRRSRKPRATSDLDDLAFSSQ